MALEKSFRFLITSEIITTGKTQVAQINFSEIREILYCMPNSRPNY